MGSGVECSKEVEEVLVRGRRLSINIYTIRDGTALLRVYSFVCSYCGRVMYTATRENLIAVAESHLYHRHGVEG